MRRPAAALLPVMLALLCAVLPAGARADAAAAAQTESGAPSDDWRLDACMLWDAAAQRYTLCLEAVCPADGTALLRYTLAPELDPAEAGIRLWMADPEGDGWSSTRKNCPQASAVLENGRLAVTGLEFSAGQKLTVQLTGLKPAAGATFGGQGIPAGSGGIWRGTPADGEAAAFPDALADLPLGADYRPADQTVRPGQAVNFGYMLRPPQGGCGMLPDGQNNAWCDAAYIVTDAAGGLMGIFRVPAGHPIADGLWDAALPTVCPKTDAPYTVTLVLTAVRGASGVGPAGTARSAAQSTAMAYYIV